VAVLAFSDAIHAAIVGGVISGVVVILGVVVTERLARRRADLQELRTKTLKLGRVLVVWTNAHTNTAYFPPGVDIRGVAWVTTNDVLDHHLWALESLTRRVRLLPRRSQIRSEVADLLGRVTAFALRYAQGRLTPDDAPNVSSHRLNQLVFGRTDDLPIADAALWYADHGFETRFEPKRSGTA
jgi:hypothetical protein